jgi:hypothetical protein
VSLDSHIVLKESTSKVKKKVWIDKEGRKSKMMEMEMRGFKGCEKKKKEKICRTAKITNHDP